MRYEKDLCGRDGANTTTACRAEYAFSLIVAVQPDPGVPFVPVADHNIIADPAEFADALLKELARG